MAIPMLWGGGYVDGTDAERFEAFKSLEGQPEFIIAFEEPDCAAGGGSAGMDIWSGAFPQSIYLRC
jgi:hypothetical protein